MRSYISVLSTNEYLPGALVLDKCLKLTKTKYPLSILTTPNIEEIAISILEKSNINIIKTNNLFLENHEIDKWYYTFSKLNIFSLTQFEKIVFIDLDTVVTENIDDLFEKKHFSSVNSGGFIHKNWVDLNSGLIVIEPSREVYNKLIDIMLDGTNYSGDQDVLHKYYRNWSKDKELNLGYQYNMFVCHIPIALKELNFEAINNIDEINDKPKNLNNIKIFHYIYPKPWNLCLENNPYYKLWYEIYRHLDILAIK